MELSAQGALGWVYYRSYAHGFTVSLFIDKQINGLGQGWVQHVYQLKYTKTRLYITLFVVLTAQIFTKKNPRI